MKWSVVKLGDIAPDMQPGFAMQPSGEDVGKPHLRTNNGSEAGHLDLSSIKRVKLSKDQIAKHSLAPGDILFNNTNNPALVGKTTLNAYNLAAGRYKPQVAKMRLKRILPN